MSRPLDDRGGSPNSEGQVVLRAVAAGALCLGVLVVGSLLFGETVGPLAYAAALGVAGYRRALARPHAAGLSASLIWAVQCAAVVALVLHDGGFESVGAAPALLLLMLVLLLPVPGLGAWIGFMVDERRRTRRVAG